MKIKNQYIYQVHQVDGSVTSHVMDRKATLQELQTWVGGLIEPVLIGPGKYGYVNEESLILDMPINASFPSFSGPVIELPKGCRV